MRVMKSMELTDDEKYDSVAPIPMPDRPDYPYGLRLCLTKAELDKLGLDPAEAVLGGVVHLHALAKITSVSCDESEYGDNCRIELQITDMEIESEDDENEEVERSSTRRSFSRIYDKPAN